MFVAPSFGGSFTYYESMINRVSLLFPFVRNEHISDISSGRPNFELFKNYTLTKVPDGKNYTLEELDEVILKYSNIKESFIPSLNYKNTFFHNNIYSCFQLYIIHLFKWIFIM